MFCCHLDQLVIQTAEKLQLYGINAELIGFITGGRKENRNRPIQIASVQSLSSRSWWRDRNWGAVILDEAHLTAFRASTQHFFGPDHEGLTIGLTATPYRLKKTESLADRFDSLVQAPPPAALTEIGHLAPLRYWGFAAGQGRVDLTGVHTRAGDFVTGELEQVCSDPALLDHAVTQWLRLAEGRRTLTFCTTVRHAESLRDTFIRRGVPASMVCGETPRAERQELYQQLADGVISVLTSVDVVAIGFDLPDVDCLLLARPTKSKAIHLQQLGRGARPSEGKESCLVLDQAGNCLRHGFLADDGPWELNPSQAPSEGGEAPVKECPSCQAIVHASLMECPECSYKFPRKEKRSRTDDLQELAAKPRLTAPHKRMQTLIRQAHRSGYNPAWASMRFSEEHGYEAPAEFWRHALFPEVNDAAVHRYTAYLAKLGQLKDKQQCSWSLNYLIREFGPAAVQSRLAMIREVWAAAREEESLVLQSLQAPV